MEIGFGLEQAFEMGSHRDYLPTTQFSYPPPTANGKLFALGRKFAGRKICRVPLTRSVQPRVFARALQHFRPLILHENVCPNTVAVPLRFSSRSLRLAYSCVDRSPNLGG